MNFDGLPLLHQLLLIALDLQGKEVIAFVQVKQPGRDYEKVHQHFITEHAAIHEWWMKTQYGGFEFCPEMVEISQNADNIAHTFSVEEVGFPT